MVLVRFFAPRRDAVVPSPPAHAGDAGVDIFLISEIAREGLIQTREYTTGLIAAPERGYYLELVPRSSFAGLGYVMANAPGIIDAEYRGHIKVRITKVCADAPDVDFCAKGKSYFQLVPRPLLQWDIMEDRIHNDILRTSRGEGAYGSTNK